MDLDLTPVLIGAGQVTEKQDDVSLASSPMDLMQQAVWRAVDSAGFDRARMADLDTIAVVKSLF